MRVFSHIRSLFSRALPSLGPLGLSIICGALYQASWAQNSSTFIPESKSASFRPLQGSGLFLGLGVESIVPFAVPYESQPDDGGAAVPFRYSVPNNYGIELGYRWNAQVDIGVKAGWESFDSRFLVNVNDFQKVRMRSFPVMAALRYRFGGRIQPEIEAAAGLSFGELTIERDSDPTLNLTRDLNSFRMSLAAGLALPWNDTISLHLAAGWGLVSLGSQTFYAEDNLVENILQSSVNGVFVKGQLRFNF